MLKILIIILNLYAFSISPLCVYQDSKGVWNFMDSNGEIFKTRTDISNYYGYREGMHRVKLIDDNQETWAYLNENGEVLFKVKYDVAKDFYEGMALVANESRNPDFPRTYGFINKYGKEIVPPKYKDAIVFQEGLAYVMNDKERGYINKTGQFEIKLADTIVGYRFSEGVASVSDPKFKHGLIDRKGNLISEFIYDEPSYFSEGKSKANYKGLVGLIDTTGNIILPFKYFEIKEFKNGLSFASVSSRSMNHVWALIDPAGNFLSEHEYSFVNNFNQGLAAVKHIKDGWKFITEDNQQYLELNCRFLNNFAGEEELAWASKLIDYDYYVSGFIDKTGEHVIVIEDYIFAYDLRLNQRLY
ncbi:WG repeat-containing protein [Candidatus Kapabacteria bacterium]|nr:WG repeat-containing protein [Candidatus Kapabacteria bacterium]